MNAIGAELVLGTGALDCWVADVQDVFPAIMDVARCFNTKVITTSDAARLPGAEHIGYDHHHTNLAETKDLACKILDRALEAHELRKGYACIHSAIRNHSRSWLLSRIHC